MEQFKTKIERKDLWNFFEKNEPIVIFPNSRYIEQLYEETYCMYLANKNEERKQKGKSVKKYSLLHFMFDHQCKEIMLPIGHYFTNPKDVKYDLVEALEQIMNIIYEKWYQEIFLIEARIIMQNELPFGVIKYFPMDKYGQYNHKGALEALGYVNDKQKGSVKEQFFLEIEELVALSYQ